MTVNKHDNPEILFIEAVITDASNASPIVVRIEADYPPTGFVILPRYVVEIKGCSGNTAANGSWEIANKVDHGTYWTFDLVGSTGNGAYTGDGVCVHDWICNSLENVFFGSRIWPDYPLGVVSPELHTFGGSQPSAIASFFNPDTDDFVDFSFTTGAGDLSDYEGDTPEFTIDLWVKADAGTGDFAMQVFFQDSDNPNRFWDADTSSWVDEVGDGSGGEGRNSAVVTIATANTWANVILTLTAPTLGASPFLRVEFIQCTTFLSAYGDPPYDNDADLLDDRITFDDVYFYFPDVGGEEHSGSGTVTGAAAAAGAGTKHGHGDAAVAGAAAISTVTGTPVLHVYRDVGSPDRRIIAAGLDGFRQIQNEQRDVNEVVVRFPYDWSHTTRDDQIIVRDDVHQATHAKVEESIDAPGAALADQCVRVGKWRMNRARLGPGGEIVTGLVGQELAPNSLIGVTHQVAGWVAKSVRVVRTEYDPMTGRTRALCEPWDDTVFTDLGEPADPGPDATTPTLTLEVVASTARKLELAWALGTWGGYARYFDVYVSPGTIQPADAGTAQLSDPDDYPEADKLVRHHLRRHSLVFRVPKRWKNRTLYARVMVWLRHDDEPVVSNLVSSLDADDAPAPQGQRNLIYGSDFGDADKWALDAHNVGALPSNPHTPNVSVSVHRTYDPHDATYYDYPLMQRNATRFWVWTQTSHSYVPTAYPTIYRKFPHKSPIEGHRFYRKGGWLTCAMSIGTIQFPSGTPPSNVKLQMVFWTGPEIGDGSEDNYHVLLEISSAMLRDSLDRFIAYPGPDDLNQFWVRYARHFKFPAGAPTKPDEDEYNRIGVRLLLGDTVAYGDDIIVDVDKAACFKGRRDLRDTIWVPNTTDEVEGDFGDFVEHRDALDGFEDSPGSEPAMGGNPPDEDGASGDVTEVPEFTSGNPP